MKIKNGFNRNKNIIHNGVYTFMSFIDLSLPTLLYFLIYFNYIKSLYIFFLLLGYVIRIFLYEFLIIKIREDYIKNTFLKINFDEQERLLIRARKFILRKVFIFLIVVFIICWCCGFFISKKINLETNYPLACSLITPHILFLINNIFIFVIKHKIYNENNSGNLYYVIKSVYGLPTDIKINK